MLQTLLNFTVGSVAVAGTMAEIDRPYEMLSATLEGRPLIAFVDHHGTAVAVDLTQTRPEIITGLAAGAILSDLRDIVGQPSQVIGQGDGKTLTVSSGLDHSEVRVDGTVRAGRVSGAELGEIIDSLEQLSTLQRQRLKSMLSLEN